MSARRTALIALALAAAFAAGLFAGRSTAPRPARTAGQAYQIREGRSGYLNPLLECEMHGPDEELEVLPFGGPLRAFVGELESEPEIAKVAVYYRDLDNGPWVGHRERDGFVPASLAKVPIVLACLRQAERDPGLLTRQVLYRGYEEHREPQFMNPEVNLEPGRSYTVRELIQRVGTYSDNAAARLLAETVGPRRLAAIHADLGLADPAAGGESALISPKQYGALFRVLYNASYLSRDNSALALESFARSSFELGLVAGVPDDVVVSHKFGVWEAAQGDAPLQLHDCGIVYHPARPYLLCVMTSGDNYVRMSAAIAAVSRYVYQRVEQAPFRFDRLPAPGR